MEQPWVRTRTAALERALRLAFAAVSAVFLVAGSYELTTTDADFTARAEFVWLVMAATVAGVAVRAALLASRGLDVAILAVGVLAACTIESSWSGMAHTEPSSISLMMLTLMLLASSGLTTPRAFACTTLATMALYAPVNAALSPEVPVILWVNQSIQTAALTVAGRVLVSTLRTATRNADNLHEAAAATELEAARTKAHDLEQRKAQQIVHDDVIAALISISDPRPSHTHESLTAVAAHAVVAVRREMVRDA